MAVQGNDNLAVLVEPDVEEVVEELAGRFKRGICYVNFGDGVIALNQQSERNSQENSPENGKRYRSRRPIAHLPAHVYALAHNVYRDATLQRSSVESHSILVSGIAGSGKTEITEMIIAQFLREAGATPKDTTPFILMKGVSALKRILTYRSASGPTSSISSMVVTLYFGQTGQFKTAKITPHLLNPRHAVPHTEDRGYLNIFYDLTAALRSEAPGLSTKENIPIILQALDPSLIQMPREILADHRSHWLEFIEVIRDLNIGDNMSLGRLGYANSFLDALLGLLLLATMQFDLDQHTQQTRLRSGDSFVIAAQLLGISDRALYNAIMSGTTTIDGVPPLSAAQSRDHLVYELYSRLVMWVTGEINSKLPQVQNGDIPIHIADLQSFLEHPTGSLQDLCHNMAAEYIENLQSKAVFERESEACKGEGMKVPVVKRQKCEEIVDLAFTIPGGLLHELETSCNNLQITDKALLKSVNTNFQKRKDLFIGPKTSGPGTFAVVHSHKQVQYHVDPLFRYQNLLVPCREAQKLLIASMNITVRNVFKPAVSELHSPNVKSNMTSVTSIMVQLSALRNQLLETVPHFVRCILPALMSPEFDTELVKIQVKSAGLPDIIHRKKFGYSHWMTIPDFLMRYSMLYTPLLINDAVPEEACRIVLKRVGILEKGPTITKKRVFLSYWHKEELDAAVDSFLWKVTLTQAGVRGHLTRKRLHGVIAARLRFRDEAASFKRVDRSSGISRTQALNNVSQEAQLFERMIDKTLRRVSDLPSNTWAKVIYMEQHQEVAKVYAAELSLFVTSSNHAFDQIELGLGYFHNPDSLEETEYVIGSLEQGIELRRDSDGSLLAKRRCQLPVCVRTHRSQPVLSADVLRTRGELPLDHFIKIFDMQEFYSLISLTMQKPTFPKAVLQKACITVIQLGGSDLDILTMPCWLAVININALNTLDDANELQSLSLTTSQLTLDKDKKDDEKKDKQEEAKINRQRKRWSRSDQRPQMKRKEANSRKIREELRNRGEKISDHMKYSWEEEAVRKNGINMDQLYEWTRQHSSETLSTSSQGDGQSPAVRSWTKINVALREATRELKRAEFEEKRQVNVN